MNVPPSELIATMLALVWSVSSVWKERGGKRWRDREEVGRAPPKRQTLGGETHGSAYVGRHVAVL